MRQSQHKYTEAVEKRKKKRIYEAKTNHLYDAFNESKSANFIIAFIIQTAQAKFRETKGLLRV